MRRRTWLRQSAGFAVAATSAPWLLGCSDEPRLTVAFHPWPGYAPLHLADHLGWWEDGPLAARRTASASASRMALAEGHAQAAALTLDETLQSIANGTPLRIVAVFNQSLGADVVLARPGFETPSRWRGARLGLESGAVGQLMADSWLQHHGLPSSHVQAVHLTYDEHTRAWQRGDVDLLVTCEPVASHLRGLGAIRVFDSSQLPAQRPILDVLAVHRDALRQHAGAVRTLVGHIFLAQRHLHAQSLDAAYRLAPWLDLPRSRVWTAFSGLRLTDWVENRRWLIGDPPPMLIAAQSLCEVLQKIPLPATPLPAKLIARQFLPFEEPL
ncbi:MAG: ABC transporter substrate-binding protein [Tepidimonas sp.]|uniref:ABC transporter substrate-binding protein n=1 Tax=Tepidimonas sp. TaxID=2002775 RepID=UPI00259F8EF4|nr:ABC transporter substrate-binding protein [Tepidimonas sp.]MDM7457718.1 ABC transporter substrate-binding protein [Tepidimonas sp.]